MSNLKVHIISYNHVGKRSLAARYTLEGSGPEFDVWEDDRIFMSIVSVDDEIIQIEISNGQCDNEFPVNNILYERYCDGIVIAYAIDDRESFEKIEEIYDELKRVRDTDNVPAVLCGTKCDLEEKRAVSTAEGEELAARLNLDFFETSAKTCVNIENTFAALVRKIHKCEQVKEEPASKTVKDKNKKEVCEIY